MATEKKLDIFRVCANIDRNRVEFFDELTEQERKEFNPFITMRWLSGTNSKLQLILLNELVNPLVFSLGHKHKQLMYYLLMMTSGKQSRKYFWNKQPPSKKESKVPNVVDVIKEYFDYDTRESINVLQVLTPEDILSYANDLGRQKTEIKKIKKELKSL